MGQIEPMLAMRGLMRACGPSWPCTATSTANVRRGEGSQKKETSLSSGLSRKDSGALLLLTWETLDCSPEVELICQPDEPLLEGTNRLAEAQIFWRQALNRNVHWIAKCSPDCPGLSRGFLFLISVGPEHPRKGRTKVCLVEGILQVCVGESYPDGPQGGTAQEPGHGSLFIFRNFTEMRRGTYWKRKSNTPSSQKWEK